MTSQHHTPTHPIAEQKSISVSRSKVSPGMTRSVTRQVKLFDDSTDSVLLVAPCDEYFHFDDSAFPRESHHVFQVNTALWPRRPQLVTQPTSTSQHSLLQSTFNPESIHNLIMIKSRYSPLKLHPGRQLDRKSYNLVA